MSLLFIIIVLAIPVLLSWPLGKAMTWSMDPRDPEKGWRGRFTVLFRKVSGGFIENEQDWKRYSLSLVLFNVVMFAIVYAIMAAQQFLPLNPDSKGALEPSLIFNTAASFVTNTNLQHYSGEVSMSYLTQLFALMWLQFVSAATGIAALAALSRGLAGKPKLGNFYKDLLNATLLVLLPLAVIFAVLLVLGGIPMTFHGAATAETLEGALQTIARGPVAAFVAIKQLGTNGGGWFGPNSTHPFENPTFFTNVVESISIVLIATASVWMFGRITGRMKHAAVIFAAMAFMVVCLVGFAVYFESAPTAAFSGLPVEHSMNLEGKELRFGSSAGPLWATITTNTSNGSVDAMHDSLNPLTGL
ncbi:MAG: potassium-transporting ATPase subunit KdpA, partial [Thermodesulfobacteriota bacterium]